MPDSLFAMFAAFTRLLPGAVKPPTGEVRMQREGKHMSTNDSPLTNFHDVLVRQGLQAGVEFLNLRVPHRYTSVYRLQQGQLNRVAFVDKLGSPALVLAHAPLKDSFCDIAVQEDALVVATDINADPRFNTVPNPARLGSYVGLPLTSHRGELFGTLCHADERCNDLSDTEFAFLDDASKVLVTYLAQVFPPGESRETREQAHKSGMSEPGAGAQP